MFLGEWIKKSFLEEVESNCLENEAVESLQIFLMFKKNESFIFWPD